MYGTLRARVDDVAVAPTSHRVTMYIVDWTPCRRRTVNAQPLLRHHLILPHHHTFLVIRYNSIRRRPIMKRTVRVLTPKLKKNWRRVGGTVYTV